MSFFKNLFTGKHTDDSDESPFSEPVSSKSSSPKDKPEERIGFMETLLRCLKQPLYDSEVWHTDGRDEKINLFLKPQGAEYEFRGVKGRKTEHETNILVGGTILQLGQWFRLYGFSLCVHEISEEDEKLLLENGLFKFFFGTYCWACVPLDFLPSPKNWVNHRDQAVRFIEGFRPDMLVDIGKKHWEDIMAALLMNMRLMYPFFTTPDGCAIAVGEPFRVEISFPTGIVKPHDDAWVSIHMGGILASAL